MGGEIWTTEKDVLDRRLSYSKEVSLKNASITTRSDLDDSKIPEFTEAFIMK